MDSLPSSFSFLSKSTGAFREFDRNLDSPGYTKKRKLSLDGQESETTISSRKDSDSLNENFSAMNIDSKSATSGTASPQRLGGAQDSHIMRIPRPIKTNHMLQRETPPNEAASVNAQLKKDQFLENLIKISQTDVAGISKYLNLDLGSKIMAWDQTVKKEDSSKNMSTSIIASFFNSSFSSPITSYLQNLKTGESGTTEKSSLSRFGLSSGSKGFGDSSYNMIGPLTREERMEKIQKFLEKKKSRRWKQVRYNIRKDLADKRERVQGRFVKTKKMSFQVDDHKSECSNDSLTSFTKKYDRLNLLDSDLAKNNLSASSTELRRSLLSD